MAKTIYVRLDAITKDTVTKNDYEKFTNLQITQEASGSYVVSFESKDPSHTRSWIAKNNGKVVSDYKEKVRLNVENLVGDDKDRIADAFKLNYLLLNLVSDLYKSLPKESVKKLSDATKSILEDVENLKLNVSNNIEKDFYKLIKREEAVAELISNLKPEILDPEADVADLS